MRASNTSPFIASLLTNLQRFYALLALLAALCPLTGCAVPVTEGAIRAHLVQWEGYRLTAYRDGPRGWSVGIGHSLTSNMEKVKRSAYTRAEIERFWAEDCSWAWDACRGGVERFDDLPQDIQLITLGVAFTCGRTGFARFVSFRRALGWRAFDLAATELATSRWYAQVSAARASTYVKTLREHL